MTEIMDYVGRWKNNEPEVDIIKLMEALGIWKAGGIEEIFITIECVRLI